MRTYHSIGHLGRWWATGYIRPPAEAFGRREDRLALRVGAAMADRLLAWDWPTALRGSGTYGSRQREAKAAGAALYVSHHWNALEDPEKDYGLILFAGKAADHAGDLADALRAFRPGRRVIVEPLGDRWGPGPRALLETFGGPAVLIEPGMLTSPQSAALYEGDGPERLGYALAEGLKRGQP